MKHIGDTSGFETPLSMTFLILAVIILSSVSTIISQEKETTDIEELKLSQARSLGITILNVLDHQDHNFNGTENVIILHSQDRDRISKWDDDLSFLIMGVLEFMDPNPWCMVVISVDDPSDHLRGDDIIVWVSGIEPGLSLYVIMPIGRSPVPDTGVME